MHLGSEGSKSEITLDKHSLSSVELVEDQTAEAFIRAFKKFASRRGIPTRIITDNAKNFKVGAKELNEILSHLKCQYYLFEKSIIWDFINEQTPWWGEFYGRLLRILRNSWIISGSGGEWISHQLNEEPYSKRNNTTRIMSQLVTWYLYWCTT